MALGSYHITGSNAEPCARTLRPLASECDVVVIGGGIHGASCARIAAAAGLSVQLLERGDFAAETSSRSSKMAHGGLRYLELFDFEQVFEGIKAREKLFEEAGNLVQPTQFLIPVPKGAFWFRIKLAIGLTLYDLFVKNKARKHRWVARKDLHYIGFDQKRSDLAGCFLYTDGIMNDTRLVLENILAAEAAGARAFNYCEVVGLVKELGDTHWSVTVRDTITGSSHAVRSRSVINCAGPWVGALSRSANVQKIPEVRLSRGVHLLFPTPWRAPSLFLPMEGKSRYYFVWPHPAGTLVGTTEREVSSAEFDPTPWREEIEEIYSRISRDLANTPLVGQRAHYCYAGLRTIPSGVTTLSDSERVRSAKESARLSRKHIWISDNGMHTLSGGKYTTAAWTAFEGVALVSRELGVSLPPSLNTESRLPGSGSACEMLEVERALLSAGYSQGAATRLVSRFGARAHGAATIENGSTPLDAAVSDESLASITIGEVVLTLCTEKVRRLEDLLRRRLEVELLPGHGLSLLEKIAEMYGRHLSISEEELEVEIARYRERMEKIDALLEN